MRLVNPRAEIRVAGGREGHLRALEPLCLWPANSLFVEGYLTTRGDGIAETYRMIRDAGFEVDGNALSDGREFLAEPAGFRLRGSEPGVLKAEMRKQADSWRRPTRSEAEPGEVQS
jgi:biotin synthase